jgi:hypothetical protein
LHIGNEDICVNILLHDIFQPTLNKVLKLSERCRASDELVKVCIKLSGELTLLVLGVFTLAFISRGITSSGVCVHCCFFKFFDELTLEDCIHCKIGYFNFNCIASIESFLDDLRVLDLILEIASKVLILMSSEIWETGI